MNRWVYFINVRGNWDDKYMPFLLCELSKQFIIIIWFICKTEKREHLFSKTNQHLHFVGGGTSNGTSESEEKHIYECFTRVCISTN